MLPISACISDVDYVKPVLLPHAYPTHAGRVRVRVPCTCTVGVRVCVYVYVWTAMDRVRAAGSVIVCILSAHPHALPSSLHCFKPSLCGLVPYVVLWVTSFKYFLTQFNDLNGGRGALRSRARDFVDVPWAVGTTGESTTTSSACPRASSASSRAPLADTLRSAWASRPFWRRCSRSRLAARARACARGTWATAP